MATALVNGRVLGENGFLDGKAVIIDGAAIAGVVEVRDLPSDIERYDVEGGLLVPGFIDTQVNGGGGVLFNDSPSVETIRIIGQAHRRFGTTGFLPTLISDDLDVIRAGIAAVDSAIAALGVLPEGTLPIELAALAVAAPVVFNTLLKLALALVIAGPRRAWPAAVALGIPAAAIIGSSIVAVG